VIGPDGLLDEIEAAVWAVLDEGEVLGAARGLWRENVRPSDRGSAGYSGEAPRDPSSERGAAGSLKIYIAPEADATACAGRLGGLLRGFAPDDSGDPLWELRPLSTPDEDWAVLWKEFFRPIRVSEHMVIIPAWWDEGKALAELAAEDATGRPPPSVQGGAEGHLETPRGGESATGRQAVCSPSRVDRLPHPPGWEPIVLRIVPGQAFGTGSHPTTQLCLRMMEKALRAGARVLDFGAGSGILSLAAVALGAQEVVAIEADPVCLENFEENARLNGDARLNGEARLNGMEGRIDYRIGSSERLQDDERFDLIVVNALLHRVASHFDALAKHLAPEGRFIASGFLRDEVDEAKARLASAGLTVESMESQEEWSAALGRRRASRSPGWAIQP
jgi:ribosomal protein L11 methyltransferase